MKSHRINITKLLYSPQVGIETLHIDPFNLLLIHKVQVILTLTPYGNTLVNAGDEMLVQFTGAAAYGELILGLEKVFGRAISVLSGTVLKNRKDLLQF